MKVLVAMQGGLNARPVFQVVELGASLELPLPAFYGEKIETALLAVYTSDKEAEADCAHARSICRDMVAARDFGRLTRAQQKGQSTCPNCGDPDCPRAVGDNHCQVLVRD